MLPVVTRGAVWDTEMPPTSATMQSGANAHAAERTRDTAASRERKSFPQSRPHSQSSILSNSEKNNSRWLGLGQDKPMWFPGAEISIYR